MSNKIKIKDSKSILVIFIQGDGKIADFNKYADKLYGYISEKGLKNKIAGPLIGIFYTEFGGKYEAAIPIREKVPVSNKIKIKTLSQTRCISIIHQGSYQTIEESFDKLKKYLKENNQELRFPVRETYLKSEGNEKDYLTEIEIPI